METILFFLLIIKLQMRWKEEVNLHCRIEISIFCKLS